MPSLQMSQIHDLHPRGHQGHRRLHTGAVSGLGANGVASAFSSFASSAQGLVSSSVRGVTIRSNLSPDITLTPQEAAGPSGTIPGVPGAAPSGGAGGGVSTGPGRSGGVPAGYGVRRRGAFSEALLAFAKPEIELDTIAGRIRVAPWGQPTTNLFWPVLIVGTASIVALGILAVKGLRS